MVIEPDIKTLEKYFPNQSEKVISDIQSFIKSLSILVLDISKKEKGVVKGLPVFILSIMQYIKFYCNNPAEFLKEVERDVIDRRAERKMDEKDKEEIALTCFKHGCLRNMNENSIDRSIESEG